MTNDTLQNALEQEHHEIDKGIEEYQNSEQQAVASLEKALQSLRRHIYLEEEIVFPPLRATRLGVPIMVMQREHGQLWEVMDRITELLDSENANSAIAEQCDKLLELQAAHNAKEEPVIYTQIDQELDEQTATKLSQFLATGTTPTGWICAAARA